MGSLMYNINEHSAYVPPKGKIIIYWLGGAGFLCVFDNGSRICIDPYLSDSVERLVGFKRLCKAPVSAFQLIFDVLLISHEHGDHLDIDSFDLLMRINPNCTVIAPAGCREYLKNKCINQTIVSAGQMVAIQNHRITAVSADHGELSPTAIGFVISFGKRSMYFTCDTGYNEQLLRPAVDMKPDIVVPCINGAFGNMDEEQAAILAAKCEAKTAVPAHYGLFKEHGGNAVKFAEHLQRISPQTGVELLQVGFGKEL